MTESREVIVVWAKLLFKPVPEVINAAESELRVDDVEVIYGVHRDSDGVARQNLNRNTLLLLWSNLFCCGKNNKH